MNAQSKRNLGCGVFQCPMDKWREDLRRECFPDRWGQEGDGGKNRRRGGGDRFSDGGKISEKITFLSCCFPKIKVKTIAFNCLDVQALQNDKSVCLPSEAISFFQQFFFHLFGCLLPGHRHVLQLAWARKMMSGQLWTCAEKVCALCALPLVPPHLSYLYQRVTSHLPYTFTTFTPHLPFIADPCRQQNPGELPGHTSRWEWPLAMAHWQWERSSWSWAEEIPLGQG